MPFKKDFMWGAATAAYQIEGAYNADGRGLSVWDVLCEKKGAIKWGNTGNDACDHYNRMKSDVALMKELGLKAYRFSISWPRVIPDGTGKVSEKGLDFYERLVDELLANGIMPMATLFHWDLPHMAFLKGGWLNRESADWFADYTKVVVDRLSDRVNYWITKNEPQCYVGLGHLSGIHAPGLKMSMRDVLQIAHNALLAHGKSVQAIRESSKTKAVIGFAPVGVVGMPATSDPGDIEAARLRTFASGVEDVQNNNSMFSNTWFSDPVFMGKYPEDGLKKFEGILPEISQDDMKIISQPIDFYGVNIYSGTYVAKDEENGYKELPYYTGYPRTALKWPLTPECLYWGPKFLYERYKKPIIITENGLSNVDWVHLDGKVHDPQRIDYISRHLRELRRAADDGVDIAGYFTWSFMDNFEWAEGYDERFGLVYVDYRTQQRTPKDSAFWYRDVIESNGEII